MSPAHPAGPDVGKSRLAAEAYRQIRSAVNDGRLRPKSQVVEAEVAQMLGISRTPVRQALRRLELEGFLERDDRGRLLVHGLSPQEVRELFVVRQLLESFGARLAATRISDPELDRLEDLLSADVEASRSGDAEVLAESNHNLHGLIMEASRNRALVQLVRDLRVRVYGLSAFAVGRIEHRRRFLEDHTRLVRLLRDGDEEAVAALMRDHLELAMQVLLEGMPEGGGVSPSASPTESTAVAAAGP
jgi:DNA-binding GntR family transcriptional regulator